MNRRFFLNQGLGTRRSVYLGRIARILSWGFFVLACIYAALFGLLLYHGKPWACVVYAENPYAHFMGAMVFLGAWHFLRKGYRENARLWFQRIGKVFLLLFSLTMCFIAGELGLRLMLKIRQDANSVDKLESFKKNPDKNTIRSDHPLAFIIQPSEFASIVYELQPDLDMSFGEKRLVTNHDGMRESRTYPRERITPSTVRILGIGDSGMFGWNVEQDEDYLAVLENRLNAYATGTNFEVINLAVPGYNSQIETEVLHHKGLSYHPDIVLVGWCENDGQLPFFLLEKEDFSRWDVSFLHLLLFQRDDYRHVASGYSISDLRDMNREQVIPGMLSGTESTGLEKAFMKFKRLRDEHGFHLLFFGPIGKHVRVLLDKAGIPYFNTYEKVPARAYPKEWLVNYMHPSREGHAVLAEKLEQHLADLGWIPTMNKSSP